MLTARDVMVSPVISVRPETSIKEVASRLVNSKVSGLPVTDENGQMVGIVSEYDMLHLLHDAHTAQRPVGESMTREVLSVQEDTPLPTVLDYFLQRNIRRIPVVYHGRPVGIISRRDIIRVLREMPEQVQTGDDLGAAWSRQFSFGTGWK